MADQAATLAALLSALNGGGGGGGSAAPIGSIAASASPYGAAASALAPALADTPTSLTASSGGANRANWSLGSGDFVVSSRSTGSQATGAKTVGQDAGGTNAAAVPWYVWALGAAALLLAAWRLRS